MPAVDVAPKPTVDAAAEVTVDARDVAPEPAPVDAGSDEPAADAEVGNEVEVEPPPPGPVDHETPAELCTPAEAERLFVDRVSVWRTIDLGPGEGMAGLEAALTRLRSEELAVPVRVRLAPGYYAPAAGTAMVTVVGLARSPAAPVLVVAADPAPNATRLGQGLALVGASYVALDGLTIGPPAVGRFHGGDFCGPGACYHEAPKPLAARAGLAIAGSAIAPEGQGERDGGLDFAVYGRYAPAHHVVVRRLTVQNLYGDDEPSGAGAAAADADGIAIAHARDVWVVGSRIREVSRHGIDALGAHGVCLLGNFIADTGGFGLAARGGSIDVTFDGNQLYNVRRLELGGEGTDAVAYWSVEPPGSASHYDYEARRVIARNNLVVDPRQGALELAGCHDCAVVASSFVYRASFDSSAGGGDAIREVDVAIARSDASAACLNESGTLVARCWNVGPYPRTLVPVAGPAGQSRVLGNARNTLGNNLFVSAAGFWSLENNPFYRPDPEASFGFIAIDHDYWWNGPNPLPDPGDGTWLPEGAHSVYAGTSANPPVGLDFMFTLDTSKSDAALTLLRALRPPRTSPLVGRGSATTRGYLPYDAAGRPRPTTPTIGALEPL